MRLSPDQTQGVAALEGEEDDDGRSDDRALVRAVGDEAAIGLIEPVLDAGEEVTGRDGRPHGGKGRGDGLAGVIAVVMPAHAVRYRPETVVRVRHDAVLVALAHQALMGDRAGLERRRRRCGWSCRTVLDDVLRRIRRRTLR